VLHVLISSLIIMRSLFGIVGELFKFFFFFFFFDKGGGGKYTNVWRNFQV